MMVAHRRLQTAYRSDGAFEERQIKDASYACDYRKAGFTGRRTATGGTGPPPHPEPIANRREFYAR